MPEQLLANSNSNRSLLRLPNDDIRKIFFVATVLSLVCSLLVSTAAVLLRPLQENNAQHARRLEILKVAGLYPPAENMKDYFEKHVKTKLVDLDSGEYSQEFDVTGFDERKAARVLNKSIKLQAEQDIAGIKRRANFSRVYLIPDQEGNISKIVLPIHGYGLWSTLYGFLALSADTMTIEAVSFYEQAETAGLGAEVTNPKWLAKFTGKLAVDQLGRPMIRVYRGTVNPDDRNAKYYVDGISGATLTSNGVTNLLHFWLGELGFGPYLAKLRQK